MTDLQFFHPASVAEAHAMLASAPLPVDSPTQRRIRTDGRQFDHLGSRAECVETFARSDAGKIQLVLRALHRQYCDRAHAGGKGLLGDQLIAAFCQR